jgi:glycerate 2-kinase
MKIVLAPNAFKECISAWNVARALGRGLSRALPDAEIVLVPVADGGDGTAETLVRATQGTFAHADAEDALGRPIRTKYWVLGDCVTAVIEMAAASGLRLLAPAERNPMRTSTRGTGQLIRAAVRRGFRRLLVGVGGSATMDGGTGLAEALGYRFLDSSGHEIRACGENLRKIARIDSAGYQQWIGSLGETPEITVACDIGSPLLGPRGARVFAPQKGAAPEEVEALEEGLSHLADIVRERFGARMDRPYAGAAGGLAAGLAVFCGALLRSGAQVVIETVGLEKSLEGADWLITGEGRLDNQTAFGKAPIEVARAARARGVRVIGVAGALGDGWETLLKKEFDAIFSISEGPMPLDEALRRAPKSLERLGQSLGAILSHAAP